MSKPIVFAENLKHYRTKRGYTQKQLADRIGYTEKSVSKWESGHALPTVALLLQLAELFCVSLDELMFEKTVHHYFLGIDGGGTKTMLKLTDENGSVLRKIEKGSCNPNDIGIENAIDVLKNGINEVCAGIPYSNVSMFAGISGGGLTGDNNKVLNGFFGKFGFYAFDNGSDIENLVALSEYEKCVLVIMGTGFIVYALNGVQRKRIAGWGQFFEDGGSGYTIGRDVITAVLSETDGSGAHTCLSALLQERLGETTERHLAKFYKGGKRYIASFSDLAFEAAAAGDATALNILEKNMTFAAEKINTAIMHISPHTHVEALPVLISGGISEKEKILFPLIKKRLINDKCQLIRIEKEPVDGALKRAEAIFRAKSQT